MDSPFDTIVAPITGVQRAAVAVVRLSGPEAWEIAARVFSPWPKSVAPRLARYGHYANGDDGLALPFLENHSYTGEQSVELSIHGSPASVRSLVALCVKAGARAALPGEFTQRAFLNGRMDLTEAEAVADTVEAMTDSQLRAANLLRCGALSDEVSDIAAALLEVFTAVEASTDFSEEIGELDRPWATGVLREAIVAIDLLLETADSGRILREGLRIAIVGPPNSGKSSLLNALLGSDRAIVTEIAGTTRDFVEESADLGGVPCVLIDTAGLRETTDPIEAIGVQRSRAQAAGADWVWYVYDVSLGWSKADEEAARSLGPPVVIVGNKADLLETERRLANRQSPSDPSPFAIHQSPSDPSPFAIRHSPSDPSPLAIRHSPLPVSSLTRDGLPELIRLVQKHADVAPERPLINRRHEPLLHAARAAVAKAEEVLQQDLPADLLSTCLQDAIGSLGQITGETASDDILEAIFSRFCVGK